MAADFDTIDHELGAIVCSRLSQLLREERETKGRSVRTLARKLKVKRRHIKKWEAGKGCPPGPVMIAIFKHYGKEPFRKLLDFDFDLQMLKYQRTMARKAAAAEARKVPAVIWAEEEQFALAA
jgi:predicted transcriptional regulator